MQTITSHAHPGKVVRMDPAAVSLKNEPSMLGFNVLVVVVVNSPFLSCDPVVDLLSAMIQSRINLLEKGPSASKARPGGREGLVMASYLPPASLHQVVVKRNGNKFVN